MNEKSNEFLPEELSPNLNRAIASIANSQVPSDTVQRIGNSASRPVVAPVPTKDKRVSNKRVSKRRSNVLTWAFAAAIGAVMLFAIYPQFDRSNDLFASMQAYMEEVKTIQCFSKILDKDGQIQTTINNSLEDDVRIRQEFANGRVVIADLGLQSMVELDPAAKTALLKPLYREDASDNLFERIFDLIRGRNLDSAVEIGREEVEGRTIVEYEVRGVNSQANVFIDLESHMTCRIVMPLDDNGTHVETSQFVFDEPLEPSLFMMTAPDGYSVTEVARTALTDDSELVLTPGVGLGPVKYGFTTAQVTALLGQPDEIFKTDVEFFTPDGPVTLLKDVMLYDSRGFQIQVHPKFGATVISCFDPSKGNAGGRKFSGSLAGGIRIGDALAKVESVMGEPYKRDGVSAAEDAHKGSLVYFDESNNSTLSVRFFEHKVVSFSSNGESQ